MPVEAFSVKSWSPQLSHTRAGDIFDDYEPAVAAGAEQDQLVLVRPGVARGAFRHLCRPRLRLPDRYPMTAVLAGKRYTGATPCGSCSISAKSRLNVDSEYSLSPQMSQTRAGTSSTTTVRPSCLSGTTVSLSTYCPGHRSHFTARHAHATSLGKR